MKRYNSLVCQPAAKSRSCVSSIGLTVLDDNLLGSDRLPSRRYRWGNVVSSNNLR